MSLKRVNKQKIGELLIERRLIKSEQLDEALKEQKEKGGYISQHLISMGFVSEKNIAQCLAEQYGFAYLPLASYEITDEILKIIPFKLVNIYSLLPVEKIGNSLSVVMADPLNEGLIDMLGQTTGYDIQVFISTYTEIRHAIDEYYMAEMQGAGKSDIYEREMTKGEILESFIQVKGFGDGNERRKYRRKELGLDMAYFFQDKSYKAKTKNIGSGGLLFETKLWIPIEKTIYANIVCNILPGNVSISAVVQVLRVEKIHEPNGAAPQKAEHQKYLIAGFFVFINEEDKKKLTELLQ